MTLRIKDSSEARGENDWQVESLRDLLEFHDMAQRDPARAERTELYFPPSISGRRMLAFYQKHIEKGAKI